MQAASLKTKLLLSMTLPGLLVCALVAWGVYQSALGQLRKDLIERGHLLATAVNEATHASASNDAIRVAVEDITRKSDAVSGITVATREPFTIWASSVRATDPLKDDSGDMLIALATASSSGIFGHYFTANGDLVLLEPLWVESDWPGGAQIRPGKTANRMYLEGEFTRPDPARIPSALPLVAGNALEVPAPHYRGVVYIRFNWSAVRQQAGTALWWAATVALAGLVILMATAWVVINRLVLRPIRTIGEGIQAQAMGQVDYRLPDLGRDELGELGSRFNAMLDSVSERDAQIHGIVDHLPIGLALYDSSGKRLLSNRQHERWSDEMAMALESVVLDDEKRRSIARGEALTWDHEHTDSAAAARHFLSSFFPVTAGGTLFGIATTEVTDQALLRAELVAAKELAEHSSAAKTQFLSSMSHELRTPLNALIGFTELMRMGTSPDEQVEYLNLMDKAGRHLLTLVNEVLDLAHVESGRLALSIEDLGLDLVLDEAEALTRPLAASYSIELSIERPGTELAVRADYTRLKQILLNLISNAIKYNRPGGKARLTIEHEADRVRLKVHDTGKGITPDQQEKLFTPFERLGAERSSIEGTGIGLTFSRRVAEAMEGRVDFESTPGEGSCFWIELPRSHARRPRTGHDVTGTFDAAALNGHRGRILYVEDNPANMQLVQSIIQKYTPFELIAAPEPISGLELAKAHQPGLILLDINLPTLDGYDVLKRLRDDPRTRDIPVVAISANAMEADIHRGLEAGFNEYLPKPIRVKTLLQAIHQLLPLPADQVARMGLDG
ncbi:MAG: ATP-binding protein [Gammaproteobacteria bacterium]